MRISLLFILSFLTFSKVYAQCDAPVVESWTVTDTSEVTLIFTAPTEAETYNLTVTYDYGYSKFGIPSPIILSGPIEPGLNTLTFNTESIATISTDLILTFLRYSTVLLSATCTNGEESDVNKFYVSGFSISSDPIINLGDNSHQPFIPLPDTSSTAVDGNLTSITIPISGFTENILDMQVFIDLGITTVSNDVFYMQLVSPQGDSIYLIEPTAYNLHYGISTIFKDESIPLEPNGMLLLHGFYDPSESLSSFIGLDPNGDWTLNIIGYPYFDAMVFGVALIINSIPCEASIGGVAYYDLNSNSIQDDDEPVFANAIVSNSLTDQELFTSTFGNYWSCILPGNGVLSLVNTPSYYSTSNLSYSLSSGESSTDLNFRLIPQPGIRDLKIDFFCTTVDRPGFESEYIVYYKNIGTECISDVEINVELDGLLEIITASDPEVTFLGSYASSFFEELCPEDNGMFSLTVYLNDTVSLGTTLESNAKIFPMINDENSLDNSSGFKSTVVGSYDPNDKDVSMVTIDPNFMESNQPLKYLIRFQNTGTFHAERVVIIDTLDVQLDYNSFLFVSASHDVNISRDGNIYTFEFNQIFLPDSTSNEPESHGYIRYEVTPLPGMADEESIENTAYIFFDFNEPIITNTVFTVMDFATSLAPLTFDAKVYPNPAASEINIVWHTDAKIKNVKVIDLTGRELASYSTVGRQQIIIPVDKLNSGIYLFRFNNDALVKPVVWIKE